MSLRDLIEETKKRLNQGASNFKGNVQALSSPQTRGDYAKGVTFSFLNRANQGMMPSLQQNYTKQFGSPFKRAAQDTQTLSNLASNTANTVKSGISDIGAGGRSLITKPGVWSTPQAASQVVGGVAKVLAPIRPDYQVANVIANTRNASDKKDYARTFAANFIGGQTGQAPITTANEKLGNMSVPIVGEVNPAAVAGQMVGFVRNPVNQQLFKATEQIKIPMKLFQSGKANAVASWLVTNGSRGFLEDVALSLRDIPLDASDKDKAAFLIKNGLWGSASEIGVRGTGELAKMPIKFLANTFDEVRKSLERTMGIRAQSRLKPIGTPPIAPPQGKPLGTPPITPESYQPLRDAVGRFAKNDIMTTAGGNKINLSRPMRWVETPTGLKRVYADNNQAFGALAGIEPEYDEEGNFTGFGYDPTKGMLGFGFMGGVKAVKDGKLQPTKGVEAIDRTKLTGKQLDTPNEKLNIQLDPQRRQMIKITGKDPEFNSRSVDPEMTSDEASERVLYDTLDDMEKSKGLFGTLKKEYNNLMNPLKNAPNEVQSAVRNWRDSLTGARQRANGVVSQFDSIPEEKGFDYIKFRENPTPENADKLGLDFNEAQKVNAQLQTFFDQKLEEGRAAGLDVGYLENYLNHVWKESAEEVVNKARGLGTKPGFTKQREIPTYEEGIKIGLTPRYSHPGQLAAHYQFQLERAIANQKLSDALLKSDRLLPASKARELGMNDWKPIDAPFFPKSRMNIGDQTIIQDYVAPPNIAKALNSIFEDKQGNFFLRAGSAVSKGIQDWTLSGGVPGTPINAFTFGQMLKEVTSGRARSPISAFFRSMSDDATRQYFKANQNYLEMMADNGVASYTNADYSKVYKNTAESLGKMDKFGQAFNRYFNEPTFQRFMPQLQLNLFKDTYDTALKNGLDDKAAQKQAADTVKKFYGLVDSFDRPKDVENALSTFFFAPKFRESMINFWGENIKAILPEVKRQDGKLRINIDNIKDPASRQNQKFMVGMLVTYGLYSALNKALSGHWMHENKDGKEFFLEIPKGDGRSIYVSFLPSVATVPRRVLEAVSLLKEGDIAGAIERGGTFLSQPVQTGIQMLTNKTFYGGPIYKEDDAAPIKLAKIAGYGLGQNLHPYLGEPIELLQGRKTPGETAMGMLELPAYPSASTDVAHLRGQQVTKFREMQEKNPTLARQYAESIKQQQDKKADKKVAEKSGLIPMANAAGEKVAVIPSGQEDFNELYKTAQSKGGNFSEERRKIEYDPTKSEEEKQVAIQELREKMSPWAELLVTMESKHPEKVFEAQIKTYASGEGMSVEERGKWVKSQLEKVENEQELQTLINRLWDEKVLTSGKSGVAQYLEDVYGINVWKYGGSSGSGGKKPKKIKLPQVNIKTTVKPSLRMFDIKPPKIDKPSVALPKIREGAIMAAIGSRPEPIRIKA